MNQSLPFLSARIKLRKGHLWEWDALVINQQKVLALVRERNHTNPFFHADDVLAQLDLKRSQTQRLVNLMIRQRKEREQMKTRHRQELVLLEQASESAN